MLDVIAKAVLPASVQSYIRAAKQRRALLRFESRVVSRTFGSTPLKVALRDVLAAEWYDHDWSEPFEIAFLKTISLRPGATVFDLGAHQCIVALMLAAAVGETGRVVALEGSAHNVEVAQENIRLNGANNLVVLNAAAAGTRGDLVFNRSLNGQVNAGAGARGQVTVPSRTVDDLAEEYGQPNLIFVDVEGYECEVLSGAATALRRGADCFVEVHGGCGLETFGGSVSKLLGFFPAARFDLYFSRSDKEVFEPLADGAGLDGRRWFLIAVHRAALAQSGT